MADPTRSGHNSSTPDRTGEHTPVTVGEMVRFQNTMMEEFCRMINDIRQVPPLAAGAHPLSHTTRPEATASPTRRTRRAHSPTHSERSVSSYSRRTRSRDRDNTTRGHPSRGEEERRTRRKVADVEASPFCRRILEAETPHDPRYPALASFDGFSDPKKHVRAFEDAISVYRVTEPLSCRLFVTTLVGSARDWYSSIPAGSITSFTHFKELFLGNYAHVITPATRPVTLLSIRQGTNESLRDFITRYNLASTTIKGFTPEIADLTLSSGLKPGGLRTSIARRPISSEEDLKERVKRYIMIEESLDIYNASGMDHTQATPPPPSTPRYQPGPANYSHSPEHQPGENQDRPQRRNDHRANMSARPPRPPQEPYIPPMVASAASVLAAIKFKPYFTKATKMTSPGQLQDTTRYCHYHEQPGHNTNQCFSLKTLLSKLAEEGLLNEFLIPEARKGKAAMEDPGEEEPRIIGGVHHIFM